MHLKDMKGLLLLLLLPALLANADEASWDVGANVEMQSRFFAQEARWPGQESQAGQISVAATVELRWRNADDDQRASIIPYLRWDAEDEERSLLDLREAYWAWEAESFELLVGANTVFWGVTESVHLVDILNQTDAVADIDGEDKLGQPMVNLAMQRDWGMLNFYVMPYFRERTFAGADGRLRTPLPVDTDRAQYESSAEEKHVDLALRYSHYVGDVDIGLSLFSGTSREPRLLPDADGTALLPYYDQINQFGVDLQYTRDAWLWKLESIVRDGFDDTFIAAVGGFEYTLYQVGGSTADVGLLLEYQYDGRGEFEPLTIADNDVFAGARLALNDTQDTAVLAGVGYDVDTNEMFINVEAERRLGEDYVLELRARAFSGARQDNPTYTLSRDGYLQLQLSRYF
jgi:hypothetical protein